MSSQFSIQKPYVVASLPRPIDHSNGRYFVGEVLGGAPGTKRRKRSELAVGIDGEGVNIYDIPSSRLITSYALPPQSSFTCPPSSLKTRILKTKLERRTYVSIKTPQPQITLFKEYTDEGAPTTSSTTIRKVETSKSPIVYLSTIVSTKASSSVSQNTSDLLSVKEDGEIQCYDGETLKEKWTSPSSALTRETPSPVENLKVEFVHQTNVYSASKGILKGRQDVLSNFPQEISEDGFNPEILILITRSVMELEPVRTLHIVNFPRRSGVQLEGSKHSVETLLTAAIPSTGSKILEDKVTFSIQVSGGLLQILGGGILTTYDLGNTLPKEQSKLTVSGAQSFLRLSNTSVMMSAKDSIAVYNPKYQSKLAQIRLESSTKPEAKTDSLKRKRDAPLEDQLSSCKLVTYFPKLGTAVGIADNNLVAVQVDGQQDRLGKPRAVGLLIDSLGCSVKDQGRAGKHTKNHNTVNSSTTLGNFLPGSLEPTHFLQQSAEIEKLISGGKNSPEELDELIAPHLPENLARDKSKPTKQRNGNIPSKKNLLTASDVDRRWVKFALSKIFSWSGGQASEPRLTISFYAPKTFGWLLINGYVTVANIEASIRINKDSSPPILAGQLVDAVVDVDPDMDLLLALLTKNYLGAAELLHAIRLLMGSFGLIGGDANSKLLLLTNGDPMDITNEDAEAQTEKLEREAEEALELAEYQLGAGSSVRGRALSVALSKLYTRPNKSIVSALQTTFNNQEIVSLIYLLRFELARGAWTTRYIDFDQEEEIIDEDVDIPDNAIVLISNLLNSCVDAIGAGGWLTGEARLVAGDPFEAEELIASLKLEVSAALEGIEEAAYLKGLTSEIIHYGDAVQKALPMQKTKKGAPVTLPELDKDSKTLPLGMKAEKLISKLRVGPGGAVEQRSMRSIGYLKSQKVGKYSRERILI